MLNQNLDDLFDNTLYKLLGFNVRKGRVELHFCLNRIATNIYLNVFDINRANMAQVAPYDFLLSMLEEFAEVKLEGITHKDFYELLAEVLVQKAYELGNVNKPTNWRK